MSDELVGCRARVPEEPLPHWGLVPEDTVVTDTGQSWLDKTVPGSRMGNGCPGWCGLLDHVQLGSPSCVQLGFQGVQLGSLSSPELLLSIPTSLCWELSGRSRNCFPVTKYISVSNNIIAIPFASKGNSTPKTPLVILRNQQWSSGSHPKHLLPSRSLAFISAVPE